MKAGLQLCFTLLCFLSWSLLLEAQLTSCPRNILCDSEQCIAESTGRRVCCSCLLWQPDGRCTPDGWVPVDGVSSCDFGVSPVAEPVEGSCLPGVACVRVQCEVDENSDTCCDCVEWNSDGSCKQDGWIPRVETQSCDFSHLFEEESNPTGAADSAPGPLEFDEDPTGTVESSLEVAGQTSQDETAPTPSISLDLQTAESPETENDGKTIIDLGAEPPVVEPETEKDLSPPETAPQPPAVEETPLSETDLLVSPISEGNDQEQAPAPEESPSTTVPLTIRGTKLEAPLPEETPSASAPSAESGVPEDETSSSPTPIEAPAETPPCPEGKECDTIRCGVLDGVDVCCECLIREINGKCLPHGWFSRDRPEEECPLTISQSP